MGVRFVTPKNGDSVAVVARSVEKDAEVEEAVEEAIEEAEAEADAEPAESSGTTDSATIGTEDDAAPEATSRTPRSRVHRRLRRADGRQRQRRPDRAPPYAWAARSCRRRPPS